MSSPIETSEIILSIVASINKENEHVCQSSSQVEIITLELENAKG